MLEQYLKDGTLPFWTDAPAFNPEAAVTEAATSTPDALVRLLRRHRDEPEVIRRLVRQLSDAGLRQLLELLDPGNAARIAGGIEAALGDAVESDAQVVTQARTGDAADDRRLSMWIRVLTDLVRERRDVSQGVEAPQHLRGSAAEGWSDRDDSDAAALLDLGPSRHGERDPSRGQADRSRYERLDLSRYDQANALSYYFRHGVLPWTAALVNTAAGHLPLTVEALLDVLPELPLPLLRTIFPQAAGQRFAAVVRAVEQMSDSARARLLIALSAETRRGEVAVDRPAAADPTVSPAAYARAILRMLDDGEESWSETADSSRRPGPDQRPEDRRDVHWIKSVLAARARSGERPGAAEPSSAALLQLLVEEHPADAVHFFRVLRAAGVSPAALLVEPVSARLLESSLTILPDRTGTTVTHLLRLVSRLPVHEQPGDEDGIRSTAMGAVLDHLIVLGHVGSGEARTRLAAGVLRALFAPAIAAVTVRRLVTEAEGLTRAGEWSVGDLTALREALDALGYAASADARAVETEGEQERSLAQSIERLPAAAARRVEQLLRIVSAWPSGDRPADDETIRASVARAVHQHAGVDPLSAAFMTVVTSSGARATDCRRRAPPSPRRRRAFVPSRRAHVRRHRRPS